MFTDQIVGLVDDDSYAELQSALVIDPEAGDLMPRCRGLRKIRWNLPGSGKRGALRVIYYWDPPDNIFMLFPYSKTEQEDLTPDQVKLLRNVVKEYLS